MLEKFQSVQHLFENADSKEIRDLLPDSIYRQLKKPDWNQVDNTLKWADTTNQHILVKTDSAYPALLREIPDAPPVLYVKGNITALSSCQIAVVGSRNPSPTGRETAHQFSRQLGLSGFTITSGLAVGIDAASHRGTLDASMATLAVTATGLDQVYPRRHQQLAMEIAENGALVSEFPPGTGPARENFPRRNRIISGLSIGTLVVEAAQRSGSLITARHATEQGREVFAIPGSIHNPLARGCHKLIRQGAKLVETIEDIFEELGPLAHAMVFTSSETTDRPAAAPELDGDAVQVLACIGYEATSFDTIVQRSRLTAASLSSILLVLELHKLIRPTHGGSFMRLSERT